MSISAKTGDGGETGLIGGKRLPKDHPLVECLGTLGACGTCGFLRPLTAKTLDFWAPLGVCKVENAQNCAFSLSFGYPSILTTPENPGGRSFGGKIYWGRFQGSSRLQSSPLFIFAAFSNIR
ncbi:MAG: ATP:cob(I)alamin adenosyltransferase, partial [Treponema sp.]|nr:ATP:cob(I)alamin adenosyltransferase [Treponema sp.]